MQNSGQKFGNVTLPVAYEQHGILAVFDIEYARRIEVKSDFPHRPMQLCLNIAV